ncbi:MAG: ATP-binding protein [Bacilli bacterium]|nr:ATP-binding protein [Bacilli bacterium]
MRKTDLKGDVEIFKYPSHRRYLKKINKGKMPYHGVYCFCGKQGSGKTLSAVRVVNNIFTDFPNCYLVTNIWLNPECCNVPQENIISFERYYQLFDVYDKPTIYLIDEAHLLFNSLESRNADVNMFQVISQQRKRQICFILTSQVFSRLQLVMREQINTIIPCKTYLNFLTHCIVVSDFDKQKDELVGKKEFGAWYTHNKDIHYKMYDTLQVIDYSKDSPFWNRKEEDIKELGYAYGIYKRNI